MVSLVKKRTRRKKEEEGKGTRALNLLFKLQAVCVCARVYDVCNTPSSYRQPGGRGQLLSRRYCTHSVWFFLCAYRTALLFHGALAVSCKYFKQSKWPFSAAHMTRLVVIFIILTLNKIFEYMKLTTCSRPSGSIRIPRRFDFFA